MPNRALLRTACAVLIGAAVILVLPALLFALMLLTHSSLSDSMGGTFLMGLLAFHAAFSVGQWLGFVLLALVMVSAAYLAWHARNRPVLRVAFLAVLAGALWTGWNGARMQQRDIQLVKANQALCPAPNPANKTALAFRAALDARAAADRRDRRFHFRVPIDDVVSRFIPAGMAMAQVRALVKDAGLVFYAPRPGDHRSARDKDWALSANCDYSRGDLASQTISIGIFAEQDTVLRTEAQITNSSL